MKSRRTAGMMGLVAGVGMASMMRGAQMVLPDNRVKVPLPPYVYQMKRKQRKAWFARRERQADNARNRKAGRADRNRLRQLDEVQQHLNHMTGWQCSQWVREGRKPERAEYWANRSRRPNISSSPTGTVAAPSIGTGSAIAAGGGV